MRRANAAALRWRCATCAKGTEFAVSCRAMEAAATRMSGPGLSWRRHHDECATIGNIGCPAGLQVWRRLARAARLPGVARYRNVRCLRGQSYADRDDWMRGM